MVVVFFVRLNSRSGHFGRCAKEQWVLRSQLCLRYGVHWWATAGDSSAYTETWGLQVVVLVKTQGESRVLVNPGSFKTPGVAPQLSGSNSTGSMVLGAWGDPSIHPIALLLSPGWGKSPILCVRVVSGWAGDCGQRGLLLDAKTCDPCEPNWQKQLWDCAQSWNALTAERFEEICNPHLMLGTVSPSWLPHWSWVTCCRWSCSSRGLGPYGPWGPFQCNHPVVSALLLQRWALLQKAAEQCKWWGHPAGSVPHCSALWVLPAPSSL